jgi:hypothetical protein
MARGQDNVSTGRVVGIPCTCEYTQGPELFLLLSFLCRGVWCLVVLLLVWCCDVGGGVAITVCLISVSTHVCSLSRHRLRICKRGHPWSLQDYHRA